MRASLSVSRLRGETTPPLHETLDWFTEGLNTPDLMGAKEWIQKHG